MGLDERAGLSRFLILDWDMKFAAAFETVAARLSAPAL
jgi:hypothetical protein